MQSMKAPTVTFVPSLETTLRENRLKRLLLPGKITDADLARRADRLDLLFRSSLRTSPLHLWGAGLHIDREWRNLTDTFLPWSRIAPALRRLICCSTRYLPPSDPLASIPSWPDFLRRISTMTQTSNPAVILRSLSSDENLRRRWLFTLFLPKEHGGGFDRYPRQQEFIRNWLFQRRHLSGGKISCLDAACGSGEGSWELAELCRTSGIPPRGMTIHGTSLDPLELYAAAHASFPHDHPREQEYLRRIARLTSTGYQERIRFSHEDLTNTGNESEKYDLILCNGFLGGPLLNDRSKMQPLVAGLVGRLNPGGLIMAADRFHEGWRKRIPKEERETLLEQCGVTIIRVEEGIAGIYQT